MSTGPSAAMQYHPADPKLWTVQSFLALISGHERLIPGEGLKRLYMMSSGLNTFYEDDIRDAAAKAEAEGFLFDGLQGFLNTSILKNCLLYAMMMQTMFNERIIRISTGEVSNPKIDVKYNNSRARRNFYIPPHPILLRIQRAVFEDFPGNDNAVTLLANVAIDAEMTLTQFQGREGYISPQPTSFAALANAIERLIGVIQMEINNRSDYKKRARPAVKLIWFITKLIMGDLTTTPSPQNLAVVDLEQRINMSDATLACIPFPTYNTVGIFSEQEVVGISLKSRTYMAAASLASFDRSQNRSYPNSGEVI